jgi:hypothetical protein
MEQILEHLLIKMNVMQERTDTNPKETKTEMKTKQERLRAKMGANNEKFEVLEENMWTRQEGMKTQIDALVSRMDAWHEEMACREAMEAYVEKTEATKSASRAKLEGSFRHQLEDVLTSID